MQKIRNTRKKRFWAGFSGAHVLRNSSSCTCKAQEGLGFFSLRQHLRGRHGKHTWGSMYFSHGETSPPTGFKDLHVRSPERSPRCALRRIAAHLQLIPADSFAFKLRGASEEKDIFVILGCLSAAGISTLGIATFSVPAWPQLMADAAAMLGSFVTVGGCFPLAK